jgi:hypothetical protein
MTVISLLTQRPSACQRTPLYEATNLFTSLHNGPYYVEQLELILCHLCLVADPMLISDVAEKIHFPSS